MGFMDFKFEHTYDNCIKQAEWCTKLFTDAVNRHYPQEVIDCLWNLVQVWEKKAQGLFRDSKSKD